MNNSSKAAAWEVCSACRGSGLQDGMDGPVNCWKCNGNIMVRIRDDKGRFAKSPLIEERLKENE